ncbi:hypothetical protein [Microbacterium terricola]|uniref:Uncharacterized protein n=1 Tax=Microbacterium terricola TaxID=344163 RepID=A0ABM8DW05_9MICO|nr:hypothetical protein [Microbacterium terricola]UYK39499.1 hypothetical protein OAU46_12440 [Microbacterium terricola]BDV29769.1 hypothetical protein Microterr_04290 [Microbacterium terricola]
MTEDLVAAATTGHRTHRYLRLSLALVVFALLAAVFIESIRIGDVLPSISHYFYTPARNVFVGALVAVSLALLALSGRDRATVLLDIAAVFAPLIALVPTSALPAGPLIGGLEGPQPSEGVPPAYMPDIYNGIITYAVVVAAIILVTVVIHSENLWTWGIVLPSAIAVVTAVLLLLLAFLPAWNDGFPFNAWPIPSIHYTAALLFFGAFAAVAILNAFWRETDDGPEPTPGQRLTYAVIGVLMILDMVLLIVAGMLRPDPEGFPWIFVGEAIALMLFAVFWVVQTVQRWDDPDQPSVAEPLAASDSPTP